MTEHIAHLVATILSLASLTLGALQVRKPAAPEVVATKACATPGGERRIEIETASGKFEVWTRKVGDNARLKVLLLHGGPGMTHDYLTIFDCFFPEQGIEYYYYDQLGSGHSDRPADRALWTTERFVDEVEQVRQALGLGPDNFCLLGHGWGGMLAIEYALKHQANLKCLVISNMMASIPDYNRFAGRTLMPAMDQQALNEIQALESAGKTSDPRYLELLFPTHYEWHILRRPRQHWPEQVLHSFDQINTEIYRLMQGPSELGAGGTLAEWDRFADLGRIAVPTLTIGARYDSMDPAHLQAMSGQLQNGQFLYLRNGSHLAMYDDQRRYFGGLVSFLKGLD